jgi:hypothetical protein
MRLDATRALTSFHDRERKIGVVVDLFDSNDALLAQTQRLLGGTLLGGVKFGQPPCRAQEFARIRLTSCLFVPTVGIWLGSGSQALEPAAAAGSVDI